VFAISIIASKFELNLLACTSYQIYHKSGSWQKLGTEKRDTFFIHTHLSDEVRLKKLDQPVAVRQAQRSNRRATDQHKTTL
jgi:hypothetical protein